MTRTVLIIEDDLDLVESIQYFLEIHEFNVLSAQCASDGLSIISTQHIDLVILDINLPDFDGFKVCSEIKKRKNTPIIVCSADGTIDTKIKMFDLKSDDFMTKPINPQELLARIQVRLRDYSPKKEDKFFVLKHNSSIKQFILNDAILKLSNTEYEVLKYLYENKNRVVSKKELNDHLDKKPSSRAYDKVLRNLKIIFNQTYSNKDILEFQHGLGVILKI